MTILGIITLIGGRDKGGSLEGLRVHRYVATSRRGACAGFVFPGDGELVRRVYKICPASAWREAEKCGVYRGSADDARDGFIHFSTSAQLADTAAKHFAGQSDLLLIAVDADALGEALRFEPSRGGELFPHLYGPLDLAAVIDVHALPVRFDGAHALPEEQS